MEVKRKPDTEQTEPLTSKCTKGKTRMGVHRATEEIRGHKHRNTIGKHGLGGLAGYPNNPMSQGQKQATENHTQTQDPDHTSVEMSVASLLNRTQERLGGPCAGLGIFTTRNQRTNGGFLMFT